MIHETAKIGKNVVLGEHAVIEENVVIGDNVTIGHHAIIKKDTHIGNRGENRRFGRPWQSGFFK